MNLRESLKAATQDLHDGIEVRSLMTDLMSANVDIVTYSKVLHLFYGFHVQLERAFKPYLSRLPELKPWTRLLENDIAVVHQKMELQNSVPAATREFEFLIPNFSFAVGVLYVIEGSSLGAQLIAKHLAQHLQVDASSGASFFAGNGKETRKHWDEFTTWLNSTDVDSTLAREGARQTFLKLGELFKIESPTERSL